VYNKYYKQKTKGKKMRYTKNKIEANGKFAQLKDISER
jgi:hypothetical protein